MELIISSNFTIDDIHKIREYNYEQTKGMSLEERNNYYKNGANEAIKTIASLKKEKELAS